MGICYQKQLDDNHSACTIFRCSNCRSHLFTSTNIQSDNFNGKLGPGFLVSRVVNVKPGLLESRDMMTGVYKVCEVHCTLCNQYVGWKYLQAQAESEKYKEKQYVMEVEELMPYEKREKRYSYLHDVAY